MSKRFTNSNLIEHKFVSMFCGAHKYVDVVNAVKFKSDDYENGLV